MTKKELRQQVACEWLEQNYLQFGYLRHDIVTDRLQIRVADSLSAPHNATSVIGDPAEDGSAYSLRAPHNATSVIGDPAEFRGKENWRNLTDKDINTMVCQKPDTELLHEVAEMLEFADGLYISEITNKSMLIEDS